MPVQDRPKATDRSDDRLSSIIYAGERVSVLRCKVCLSRYIAGTFQVVKVIEKVIQAEDLRQLLQMDASVTRDGGAKYLLKPAFTQDTFWWGFTYVLGRSKHFLDQLQMNTKVCGIQTRTFSVICSFDGPHFKLIHGNTRPHNAAAVRGYLRLV
ncbi:hypothetical protein J6590_102579 [Homalodisca vitripennis]|nr:hypothetical protein J6590_102579 [Homalodisca vitripennis]